MARLPCQRINDFMLGGNGKLLTLIHVLFYFQWLSRSTKNYHAHSLHISASKSSYDQCKNIILLEYQYWPTRLSIKDTMIGYPTCFFISLYRNFMNDSLRTDVFVRYPPETIAVACIYLSARKLQVPLPKNPAWFDVLGVEEDDIKDCCYRMICLYNRKKVRNFA